jgi:Raf kinase inhibitor-like YbhB/YbcL family protein
MRTAYALLGLVWLIIIVAGVYAFNHKFTGPDSAGVSPAITNSTSTTMTSALSLTSSAFENNGTIPSTYTCDDRRDMNPPLSISGVPEGAKSLVLLMDDPDVPKAVKPDGMFDHWVLFNIPPETREIAAGVTIGVPGVNGAGNNAYTGPCPPPQYEPSTHRYFFKLYALDSELSFKAGVSKAEVEKAMQGHIVAEAQLVGRYKRQ